MYVCKCVCNICIFVNMYVCKYMDENMNEWKYVCMKICL